MKRYDLFYDENNKPTMVERPDGSGQFVFAKDADAEIARLNDELTCGSEAYHSVAGELERLRKALLQIASVDCCVSNERFRFFSLPAADAALRQRDKEE